MEQILAAAFVFLNKLVKISVTTFDDIWRFKLHGLIIFILFFEHSDCLVL